MRAGKDVMVDKPGVITFEQLAAVEAAVRRNRRASSRSAFPSASSCRRRSWRAKADRRRGDRPGDPDHRPRAASPEPGHPPDLVLRPERVRRHPDRHRLAPDRPVPALHGLARRRDRRRAQRRISARPGAAGLPGFRRDPAAQRPRAAAMFGSTGSRPTACRPGATAASPSSAPTARSSCASMSTSRAGRARTTSSWSTERDAPHRRTPGAADLFPRLVADVRDRTETAMSQNHVFTVCRLALQAQAQRRGCPTRRDRQEPGQHMTIRTASPSLVSVRHRCRIPRACSTCKIRWTCVGPRAASAGEGGGISRAVPVPDHD